MNANYKHTYKSCITSQLPQMQSWCKTLTLRCKRHNLYWWKTYTETIAELYTLLIDFLSPLTMQIERM
jgi:hypothetical protein